MGEGKETEAAQLLCWNGPIPPGGVMGVYTHTVHDIGIYNAALFQPEIPNEPFDVETHEAFHVLDHLGGGGDYDGVPVTATDAERALILSAWKACYAHYRATGDTIGFPEWVFERGGNIREFLTTAAERFKLKPNTLENLRMSKGESGEWRFSKEGTPLLTEFFRSYLRFERDAITG